MTEWIDVATLREIPKMGSRLVRRHGVAIAVFRTADDRIFALEDRCPHKSGPLSQGIVHGCRVTCPLHSQVIDLASGEVCAPDQGRVKTFPARVRADGVVELGFEETPASTAAA